jgi:histidine triad (HIT) family protein
MAFSRKVAIALEQVVSCKRVGMTVIGLEVPHVHVHLIPLNAMEDAQFNKKVQLEPKEFAQLAQSIQEQFNKRA